MGAGASAVLFGGLASERPYPGSTSITTVNGAVSSLIRTLAVELAPVRFNAIHPGIISDSPAWSDKKEAIANIEKRTPGGGSRDDGRRGRRRRLPVHEPRRERHQPRDRRRLAADLSVPEWPPGRLPRVRENLTSASMQHVIPEGYAAAGAAPPTWIAPVSSIVTVIRKNHSSCGKDQRTRGSLSSPDDGFSGDGP
jgi:NAD(P)-dependent dehydrogenase (short-subunit alcohol dehydrogenase family)